MSTMLKYSFFLSMTMFFLPVLSLAGQYRVIKVYDGNTVKISGQGKTLRVRLVGIDAPEKSQPYGSQSKKHLANLVLGRTVTIRIFGTGPHKRLLGEIYLGDFNVNIEMLRAGLVEVYQGAIPEKLDIIPYLAAEQEARNAEAGMWILGTRYVSPRLWRKARKRMGKLKSMQEQTYEPSDPATHHLP